MKKLIFILFLILFCLPIVHAEAVSQKLLSAPELIKALQTGEHIIYMRHGATVHTQKDTQRNNLDDCRNQRNLSPQGIEQLINIAQTIKNLKIPIGKVISSPYCRCKDTAHLTFDHYEIEPKLAFSISKNKEESKQLGEDLHTMMNNVQPGPDNVVFVGHTSNLKDGLGVWPKPEGAMVIFKKHDNQLIYLGIVTPDVWGSTDKKAKF